MGPGNAIHFDCISIQISELGIDYEGPINYNSTDSVQLDGIDPVISTEERDLLTRVLADMENVHLMKRSGFVNMQLLALLFTQ